MIRARWQAGACAAMVAAAIGASGCGAIKGAAIKNVASTLSSGGSSTLMTDDDPELVRRAIPFGLKLYESLLESVPKHVPLLVTTCSGYTGYAYAFLETDAAVMNPDDHHDEIQALRAEAVKLYLRGKGFCMRAMELRFPGITDPLLKDPKAALKKVTSKDDVPLLYWTAASWGAAMSLRKDPDLVIDFPVVRALVERGLELEETWDKGSLHELMLALDAQGPIYGGSEESARKHFARAIELRQGLSAGPYVSLAEGVERPKDNRDGYETLLNQALAIDPNKDLSIRLLNIISQKRAKALLDHIDELFPKAPTH